LRGGHSGECLLGFVVVAVVEKYTLADLGEEELADLDKEDTKYRINLLEQVTACGQGASTIVILMDVARDRWGSVPRTCNAGI
jgi:hypothetical protein